MKLKMILNQIENEYLSNLPNQALLPNISKPNRANAILTLPYKLIIIFAKNDCKLINP